MEHHQDTVTKVHYVKTQLSNMWPDLTKAGFHTHNGKADFSPLLDFYINELTIHVCIITNGSLVCFSWGLFLRPVWCAWVLRLSSNGSGLTGQAPTQLEIATWLARKLGHQNGYYLWYLELQYIGLRWDHLAVFNFYTWKNPPLYGSPPLPTSTYMWLWYWFKNYLKWQTIQLAVHVNWKTLYNYGL